LTAIDLSSNLLVGSIPPKLGLLSNLGYLNLMSNQLNGSIPGEPIFSYFLSLLEPKSLRMIILTIILVQVLCCHLITKIT